jgi:hypothetical protein
MVTPQFVTLSGLSQNPPADPFMKANQQDEIGSQEQRFLKGYPTINLTTKPPISLINK